jgi:hypothetical protein
MAEKKISLEKATEIVKSMLAQNRNVAPLADGSLPPPTPPSADDIASELEKNAEPTFIPDTWIYRIVVLALGITIVSSVVGVLILMATCDGCKELEVPTVIVSASSAGIAGLVGLLAPSPRG